MSFNKTSIVMNASEVHQALSRAAGEILERGHVDELALVGIRTRGVPLARRLAALITSEIGTEVPVGVLDITLYRDDLTGSGARPPLRRTEMPSAVDDQVVILVDDVASTGRTIRAAMDALMDFGRPRAVQVVALVDRGHRELPIKIDYVGKNIPTKRAELVKLRADNGSYQRPLEVVVMEEGGRADE